MMTSDAASPIRTAHATGGPPPERGLTFRRLVGAGGAVAIAGGLALAFAWSLPAGQSGPSSATVAYAQGQEPAPLQSPAIAVVGEGVAQAPPDVATIRLGIQVIAPSPTEALNQTRQAADQLLAQLRGQGVQDADLQTTSFNILPITDPVREGTSPGAEQVTGYRGIATVAVQNQDIGRATQLLDAAVQAGATSVQGVSFGFRDPHQLQRQAMNEAIAQARQEAQAAAAAAGLRLGGIRAVQELTSGPPVPLGGGLGAANAAGGLAPGELTVSARVQVTFDVTA